MIPRNAGVQMVRSCAVRLCAVIAIAAGGVAQAAIVFQDVTTAAGFVYEGESFGASWGDVNGDGWPDLFANNHQQFPSLYINNKQGGFTDEAYKIQTWVNAPNRDKHGGSWGDIDNDGDSDFMLTTGRGSASQFFENQNGVLVEKAIQYNLNNKVWAGRQGVWFDYDSDGKLDVIVGNFNGPSDVMHQASGTFVKVTSTVGATCTQMPYGQLIDIDRDGTLDLWCGRQGKSPWRLYDTTSVPFIDIKWMIPEVGSVADTALADFDNNMLQDVFYVRGAPRSADVAQAGSTIIEAILAGGNKGYTYRSTGVQTFDVDWRKLRENGMSRIKIGSTGYSPPAKSFSLYPGDSLNWGNPPANNTGQAYLHIGYNQNTGVWTVMHYTGSEWSDPSILLESTTAISNLTVTGLKATDKPMAPFLHSATTSGYVNTAKAANINAPVSCTSIAAEDLDNDMDIDLYLVCSSGVKNLPNRLYENRGNGVFDLVPNAGGAAGPVGVAVADGVGTGDSVVTADYDVDGDIDLFVTNGLNNEPPGTGGPVKLFRNTASTNGNHWIELDLQGTVSNRDGVGARVIVTAGGVPQLREQNGGYHRWSQNFDRIHVGLAGNQTANIRIEWPSGEVDTHQNVSADRIYRFVENGGYTDLNLNPPGP